MSSVSRLTLFALISSLEEDLRSQIRISLLPQQSVEKLFGDEIYRKCLERYNRDLDMTQDTGEARLVDYLDFGESFEILNKNKPLLPELYAKHLQSFTQQLQSLIPVRNRVMHTRPLNFDDLAKVSDVASNLLTKIPKFWKRLAETKLQLESDPSFVLGLAIPPPTEEDDGVNHNLPLPDFDETGFLGRQDQVDELIKTCLGPYPVVTIVGEGGIGKTALALRVAYELVDKVPHRFDYVVWTSSKTTKMTAQEMVRIEGAIESSLGLIQSVAVELGAKCSIEDESSEILSYLTEFRILLILDNLETVLDDRIRYFLQNLPAGSKVLITSRIGLGALEYPIRLKEMDEQESVQLLRALARARNVEQLVKIPNVRLAKYCARMKFNPGFIKWFVSAVQAGKRPEDVLSNTDVFLDFCMSNVYEYLSDKSRQVLKSMQTVPGDLSQAELAFLSGIDDLELQKVLQELLTTNMVTMTSVPSGATYESSYDVSDLARVYLAKKHPPSIEESKRITRLKNHLISITQEIDRPNNDNPYSLDTITIKSRSDIIVAKYLREAIFKSRRQDYDAAEKLIQKAKRLAPEFFEVHRVEAMINNSQGKLAAAKSSYEAAIELKPDWAPLRKWFAQFLFKRFQDYDEARRQLLEANRADPSNFSIEIELARLGLITRDFDLSQHWINAANRKEKLSSWDKVKLFDLKLGFHLAKGLSSYENRDVENAVNEFRLLIKAYIDCPANLRDDKMKEKLKKAIPAVSDYRVHMRWNSAVGDDVLKIYEFLVKYGETRDEIPSKEDRPRRRRHGKIYRVKESYGFIRTENRDELFFHFSGIKMRFRDRPLEAGQRVSFRVTEDEAGRPRATGIIFLD